MADLLLAEPIPLQRTVLDDPARFKILRWGRRGSKTRTLWTCSLTGHGPGWPEEPMWPGVLHGWDVVWLARDLKQGRAIWREDIVPRCLGVDGVHLNNSDFFVTFAGLGTLYLRSFENVDSIRGIGARLKGAVTDEGAHFDLEYAWRRVIRPTLADNTGWAIFGSTTNGAYDGNAEQKVPSFFNRLCVEVQEGKRGPEWREFYATAEQNPRIDPVEYKALVAEYPPDSTELAEEVYAQLLTAGGGLLFGYLSKDAHLTIGGGCTPGTRRIVAADWGWASPASAIWIETDSGLYDVPRSRAYREWWPTEMLPHKWAATVCEMSKGEGVECVVIDSATQAKGQDGSPSVFEQMLPTFHKAGVRLVAVEKGQTSLKNSTALLHTYFWTDHGQTEPLLTISADCPKLWAELTTLRRGDPKHSVTEDPNLPAPHQSDHGYDCLRYWAMSRPRPALPSETELRALDKPLNNLAADPLSQLRLYRERAQQAVKAGKPVPPMSAPPKAPRRRQAWER